MANEVKLKRSAVPGKIPTTSALAIGELAINTHDGFVFLKKSDGTNEEIVSFRNDQASLDYGLITENGE